MIRVIVVDDHSVFRAGLRAIMGAQQDFELVADVGDLDAAYDSVIEHHPNLVVLDLSMPGGGGMSLIGSLQELEAPPKILILSMYDDPSYARAALAAGATGYVVKTISEHDLVNAMRAVSRGQLFIDLDDAARTKAVLFGGIGSPRSQEPPPKLSNRELEVLRLLGLGHSNQSVAEQLELSAKTVATYRVRISEKLGIKTTADFVRYVSNTGLGDKPDPQGNPRTPFRSTDTD